jgi:hypothetical protein
MLTVNECKKILNAKDNGITDEQVKKIIDLLYFWASIEYKQRKTK